MCIAIAKKEGIKIPKWSTIIHCFEANPDGTGVMVKRQGDNKIHILKGFMTIDECIDGLHAVDIQVNDTAVYHFRYATHGHIIPGNCHPFPLVGDFLTMKQTEIITDTAIVHNGILYQYTPKEKDVSDTMEYVKAISILGANILIPEHLGILEQETEGSRLAYLTGKDLHFTGNWITDKETGLIYSNSGYKPYKDQWEWEDKQEKIEIGEDEFCCFCGEKSTNTYFCSVCGEILPLNFNKGENYVNF